MVMKLKQNVPWAACAPPPGLDNPVLKGATRPRQCGFSVAFACWIPVTMPITALLLYVLYIFVKGNFSKNSSQTVSLLPVSGRYPYKVGDDVYAEMVDYIIVSCAYYYATKSNGAALRRTAIFHSHVIILNTIKFVNYNYYYYYFVVFIVSVHKLNRCCELYIIKCQ